MQEDKAMKSIVHSPLGRAILGAFFFTFLALYVPIFLVHARLLPLIDIIPDIDFCDMQAPTNRDTERCDAALWTVFSVYSLFLLTLGLPVSRWSTSLKRFWSLLALAVVLAISFWAVLLGVPVAASFFGTGKQAALMGELDAILFLGGPILCALAFLTFYGLPRIPIGKPGPVRSQSTP
ncbi:MAG: hypothetical protein CMN77_12710 [Spirochaetaceae bacterium]|nr:hypothetical protein [Spirochaetaceae bacterium]